jgi:hypothetical protein
LCAGGAAGVCSAVITAACDGASNAWNWATCSLVQLLAKSNAIVMADSTAAARLVGIIIVVSW